jgi:hypothetical protein
LGEERKKSRLILRKRDIRQTHFRERRNIRAPPPAEEEENKEEGEGHVQHYDQREESI